MKTPRQPDIPLICMLLLSSLLHAASPSGRIVGWGFNAAGASTGTRTINPPTMSSDSTGLVSIVGQTISNAMAVAAGGEHALALLNDGTVVGWGANHVGQATGSERDYPKVPGGPVKVRGEILMNVAAIAAGRSDNQDSFSLALKRDGTVAGWGGNTFGQANPPPGLRNVVAIAAGYAQGLALTKEGTVVTWGHGNPSPRALSNVVAVAAGGESGRNLALKADGTVVDWHVRSVKYNSTVPEGLTNVVAIAAGSGYGLALRRDGTVLGWGANRTGAATGIPTPVFPNEATGTVMVAGQTLSNIVAITAGADHSLALKSDGAVVSWGHPLGKEMPVPAGLRNVISIAAGENFCLAITTNPTTAFRRQ